ncbi:MAG: 6-hydroxymethylpterin diphosphokinase MptE-like protein [Spirochaetota bacterium]
MEERYRAFNINLEKNIDLIRKSGGLREVLADFKNKHVIVAGAGPSIQNNIEILKKYQYREELIIISTDMALLPLYNKDIFPKYVISCETTPVDYFSNINTENMHLLAFSCMSNTNLRKWKGKISFYNWMIHNEMYNKLWMKAGYDLGFVGTGSIVTTQAISLALGCDINSLMLIGNDMGFRTEYYIRDTVVYHTNLWKTDRTTSLERIEMNNSRKRREFKIFRGDKLYYTNNQFLAAKTWLEDLFKRVNKTVYEANELGCSPQFVQKISLKKYLERLNKRSVKRR